MIAMVVKVPGKRQNFGWAKFDAEPAALTEVPIYEDLATELASFWGRGSFRHVNLEKKRNFPILRGTACPIQSPVGEIEHFHVHFDRANCET
jgi:hypothetical protein